MKVERKERVVANNHVRTRGVSLLVAMVACTSATLPLGAPQEILDTAVVVPDADGDGFSAIEDCDDSNPQSNPGRLERCDGVDDDCDGTTDEDDAVDAATWYVDADGDGFGSDTESVVACEAPDGYADNADDCDDLDPLASPAGVESGTQDYLDSDCDGYDEVVYDAVADFSATENPNGAWTYGYCGFDDCVVTPFTTYGNLDLEGMAFWMYDSLDSTSVKVGLNTTDEDIVGPVVYPPYTLVLHPGADPPLAVIQWIAPDEGDCLISFEFTSLDLVTSGVSVWHTDADAVSTALLDEELLTTTECEGENVSSWELQDYEQHVSAGDTIDARVSWGCDGNVGSDSVGLTMKISCAFSL